MAAKDTLADYRRKRDFKKTREPSGGTSKGKSGNSFVIQKHDASRLHYDFRLEIDGVLKSWAVPKGVPLRPDERHLAVEVEDHPLEYGRFEGTIPEGNYGGGTVMLWDFGTYELLGGTPLEAWREGKLHFTLAGRKLDGEWTLIRTRRDDDKNQWLLLKTGGESVRLTKKDDEHSAVSGRTMRQIAEAGDAVWKSSRPAHGSSKPASTPTRKAPSKKKVAKAGLPAYVAPMKPVLVSTLPEDPADWLYEIKFDGYRALALKRGPRVELWSASHKPLDFPDIAQAVAELPCEEAVVDGEIVALDEKGRSSFQLLQNARGAGSRTPLRLYAFDLLRIDGEDLSESATTARKERLATLLADQPEDGLIRFSADLTGSPAKIVAAASKMGLEGVVAKQRAAPYRTGRRTPEWQKYKLVHEQEFVIGGYTPPGGSRKYFGAVLVGYYEDGKLQFAAKVGSGFSGADLAKFHRDFQALRQDKCPFANLPAPRDSRWGQKITAARMGECTWLRPTLVCQVRFAEWTGDGGLRQPVFLGLREDKKAQDVIRERPKPSRG